MIYISKGDECDKTLLDMETLLCAGHREGYW